MTGVEDLVVAELRSQKIKLWEAPYVNTDDQTSPNRASLETLADQLLARFPSSLSKDDIVTALLSLQEHALNKKKAKQAASSCATVCNLEVKVVGLRHDITNEPPPTSWADRVEIKPKALVLHGLNSQLTVATFVDELKTLLEVSSSLLRLVHRGKSISDDERLPLVQVLSQHCKSHKTTLLCIVSPTVDTTAPQQQQDSSQSQPSPSLSLIRSIRDAATKLASNTFEVTDQHGNHVSMLPQERLAFLTALGLHAIGKQRMLSSTNWSDALVFLLEADHEWNGVAQQWRDRVDNYGLLQLDICWLYLKLESLESLEDVVKRLDVAERVLRKQVHTNFVTLALVQADMGNPVPPLSAVFCRLFLLQGIAYHFCKAPSNKSKERLEWAYALCSSLRSVSTRESVTALQAAMPNLTQEQAISALRRSNGNPNQAAQLIETDRTNAIQHESKRRTQRKLGLCENTKDYVNLDLLEQLQSVLGLPTTTDGVAFSLEDVNTQAAAGLLRLSNNDMERAIDLYQEVGRNPTAVLQRVDGLDDSLRKQGIESPRRKRSREHEVDQVALATLVSMGVQEPTAKQALKKSQNNVEMALLWLSEGTDATNGSNHDDISGEANDAADGTDGSNHDDMSGEANVDDDDDESSDDSDSGSSHNDSMSSSSHNDARTLQERERDRALELLQQELGQALQEKDLESEYLGSTLDEEWEFLAKFRSNQ